jgi:predicted aconitase with swiveling domain
MAKKIFKGRVIAAGEFKGEAVVSHQGFNMLASVQKSAMFGKETIICSDQNNKDLFNKVLTGKILCLPLTIGSTTGGMILQAICSMGNQPAAMLFSETADSLAVSGLILSKVWEKNNIIGVDQLGKEFLDYVKDGMIIQIKEDGTVITDDSITEAK